MRIVLDTNVFVSGVFFGGVPGRILEAWRDARVQLVLSAGSKWRIEMGSDNLWSDGSRFGSSAHQESCLTLFRSIVSGDKDMLDLSGWRNVRALRPRQFTNEFLSEK